MATKFIETGDADFGIALWPGTSGTGTAPSAATDFVHGSHLRSTKYFNNGTSNVTNTGSMADAGRRISAYFYFNAFPAATCSIVVPVKTGLGATVVRIRITSAGVLQLWEASNQIGSNGSTLSTGTWYRLCLAYTITSTTVNQFRLYKNGVSDISVSNATITNTASADLVLGNASGDGSLDMRTSDHYIDDSNALTDPGDIWVTAKRPNANGTTNNFNTQIGSGGSGYGTGHSPQVNERALSITNGWSVVAVAATTEEYNIESASTGDIDISSASIVDYMGWVDTKALVGETGQIVLNNVTSNISITTSAKIFTAIAGSTTYPAGTGTDIGEVTSATATTVSLYEAGIVFAYIPSTDLNINVSDTATLTESKTVTIQAIPDLNVNKSDTATTSESTPTPQLSYGVDREPNAYQDGPGVRIV